jgi:hypothetical protein
MSKWISFSLNSKMIGGALPAEFAVPNQRFCGAWGDIPRLRSEQASRKMECLSTAKATAFCCRDKILRSCLNRKIIPKLDANFLTL